MKKIPTLSL
jgi:hypothetical protein